MASFFDFLNVYVLFICAFALFWYYIKSTFNYWRKLNVKYLQPTPFFGNTASFVLQQKSLQETLDDIYKELQDEPFGGIFMMRDPQLLVKDPDLVNAILVKDFKNFHDRIPASSNINNRSLNPLSGHLLMASNERWRILRQKMSPIFSPGQLKHMYDQISYCVGLLTRNIDEQMDGTECVDLAVKPEIEKFTIDVIGACAFGLECDALKSNNQFTQMCREFFNFRISAAIQAVLSALDQRLLTLLRIPAMPKKVSDFYKNLALDTVEYRRQNGAVRKDLLQLLMNLQNSHVDPKYAVKDHSNPKIWTNEEFDELDIAANSFLFFVAGYETTAATLSFCLYELAINQDIQQKVRLEVQQIQHKYDTNYDSLKKMTYLDAVIAETVRKYPPVIILNRVCTEEYVIPNTKVQIPAGTNVLVPIWSIHHDSKNYPNPEVFDPERFIGDNKQSRPDGAYVPFGNGPKFCLGKRFAELELKAVISVMVMKYDLKPCAKTDIPLTFKKGSHFLHTKNGIWINLSKRKIKD